MRVGTLLLIVMTLSVLPFSSIVGEGEKPNTTCQCSVSNTVRVGTVLLMTLYVVPFSSIPRASRQRMAVVPPCWLKIEELILSGPRATGSDDAAFLSRCIANCIDFISMELLMG